MAAKKDAPFGFDPQLGEAAALKASGMGEAAMKDGQAAMKGIEAGSRQWMDWAQKAYQANLAACQALMTARTPKAVAAVHTALAQEHLKLMLDNGQQMAGTMMKSAATRARAK